MRRPLRRAGFTLIELLVVIAILAVLIGLLLPAVQKIRESAANAEDRNNLYNLGLAVNNFNQQNSQFPRSLAVNDQTVDNGTGVPASAFFQIRPFIEQKNTPVTNSIKLLRSPLDPRGNPGSPYGLTNYVFVEGKDDRDGLGIVVFGRDNANQIVKVRTYDITDGASNTIMIGPRPPSPDLYWGRWGFTPFDTHLGSANTFRVYLSDQNGTPCPVGQSRFGPGDINNPCDIHHFWSPSSIGGNFCMGDGSVRFFNYSASPLLIAASTRAGKESVNLDN